MGTVYAFMNLKGGVGKTTLAANLGHELGEQQNAPVLLIDTDPQCNLTQVFYRSDQLDQIHVDRTVYATFKTPSKFGDPHPADLRTTVSGPKSKVRVDLIPGSFATLKFGVMQNGLLPVAMMQNFGSFVEQCKAEYGSIILDTNPSSTFTTLCALSVADFLVAPVTLDAFSLKGIDLIREVMSTMYPWLNDPDRVKILLNRVPRTTDAKRRKAIEEQEQRIRQQFRNLIPPSVKFDSCCRPAIPSGLQF